MARRRERPEWNWRDWHDWVDPREWHLGYRLQALRSFQTAVIVIIGALAFLSLLPYHPIAQRGPICTHLAAPLGGNNRSALAEAGNDPQRLGIELRLDKEQIVPTEPLKVHVNFENRDIGSVILYIAPDNPILVARPDVPGVGPGDRGDDPGVVIFEITRVGSSYTPFQLNLPFENVQPAPIQREFLHLLGARARCSEEYIISLDRLGNATPGEYRIRAFYGNNNPGALTVPGPGAATPTATPAYTDQGIWTGVVVSDDVIFSIVTPTAVPAAAPGG